ncbi:MAG: type II toxin-antitoxin system prevent-host-death family antitoxin [Acidobacteriota bacterium]|nr:type II toxin-antitoxin system prevent-host-death family antitoxin [Acidobacteriota bacterium]
MPRTGKSRKRVPLKKRIAKSTVKTIRAAGADLAELAPVGRESPNPRNSVSSSAFRSKFGHYLDLVERGSILRILRRGRAVAMLVPVALYDRLAGCSLIDEAQDRSSGGEA